jgi:hypothetical protein
MSVSSELRSLHVMAQTVCNACRIRTGSPCHQMLLAASSVLPTPLVVMVAPSALPVRAIHWLQQVTLVR